MRQSPQIILLGGRNLFFARNRGGGGLARCTAALRPTEVPSSRYDLFVRHSEKLLGLLVGIEGSGAIKEGGGPGDPQRERISFVLTKGERIMRIRDTNPRVHPVQIRTRRISDLHPAIYRP